CARGGWLLPFAYW
nr:immunoglobulin heavy chain junction region [Mus musculus]MBK4186876.1 immunoglobulin heavy chain junction region [Mus musculus]